MSSNVTGVHFIKMINEDSLKYGELRIPRSFVNKCWVGMSKPIVLVLPNGAEWTVKWKKLDADIWLIDDWKEFAEFCCLDLNHRLVFKYLGKSRFQVVIFDQNGLEMEYPLNEGVENCSNSIKKVKTNPRKEPTSFPCHDAKTESAQSQMINVELSKKFYADDLDKAKPKRGGIRRVTCSESKAITSEELSEDTQSCIALQRAKAFSSDNPFFIREMKPTYIYKSLLLMPGDFITEEEQKEDDHVFLWISEERAWHVKFSPAPISGQILLTTGWMDFVKDNNLKIGNVCVFEQIKKYGISFRVFIFRDPEESSVSKFPANDEDSANRNKQTELLNITGKRSSDRIPKKNPSNNAIDDSKFCSGNSQVSENHFTLSIKAKKLYCVRVPRKFIENHNIGIIDKATLQVGKKSWNVRIDSYGRFTSGWSEFRSQCNLEAGDLCSFELIDKENFVFNVLITRSILID